MVVFSRAVGGLAVGCSGFACAQILLLDLVSVEQSEAVGTVTSRFEGTFLSVARGAPLSFSTGLSCKVCAWFVTKLVLSLCPATFRFISFRLVLLFSFILCIPLISVTNSKYGIIL